MQIDNLSVQKIIRLLMNGRDYRIVILPLIEKEFLQYTIDFFKKVATAKLDNQFLTKDWYKATLLNPKLPPEEIIIHSGLNKKSIFNAYGTARKNVVLDVTSQHYDQLYKSILDLVA